MSDPDVGRIRVGTSGWTYAHWRGVFFPPELKSRELLPYYCRGFDSVEANVGFYRLPAERTFTAWHKATPPDFIFSLKAHRYITHGLRLKDAGEPLVNVVGRYASLREKLGPILFQFAEKFECDSDRLREFLPLLPEFMRFTFEFRHDSWFTPEVYELLREHGCALTIADTPDFPMALEITAGFVYVRLHGGRVIYQSAYTDAEIAEWGKRAQDWAAEGRDVYIYFDNDFLANAPRNALTLRRMLGQIDF